MNRAPSAPTMTVEKSETTTLMSEGAWAHATWSHWNALRYNREHISCLLDMAKAGFPLNMPTTKSDQDVESCFQTARVSGRPPSDMRQSLEFCRSIAEPNQQRMVSFLNYIICFKCSITPQTVSVIQRCLLSRHAAASKGHGPVWDFHETFQIGHW
jgi:hypothetical protein